MLSSLPATWIPDLQSWNTPFRPSTTSWPRTWNNSLSNWQARSQRTFALSAKGYGKLCEQRTLFSKLYLPVDILAIEFIRKSLALPNTDRRSALALENNTHLFNAFFQKTSGLEKGGVCPYLSLQSQQISSIRFSTSLHSPLASRSSKYSFSGFLIASGTLLNYN